MNRLFAALVTLCVPEGVEAGGRDHVGGDPPHGGGGC